MGASNKMLQRQCENTQSISSTQSQCRHTTPRTCSLLSHIKSWTKEESAKEYDRLAGAYMALRHEHISVLVDQDSKEKNARRQVVDSRQSLANGAHMLLWNSEAAFEASKAIAGRICQPSIWTDPQTQTQYTGKAPGSFTPQEAQHILNLHKDDCIKDLKGATLAATGANLEEFGIDETIVTQAYDLPGDRSWFEQISDNWKDAARDVLVDSSMDLSMIEETTPRRQVSFPLARTKGRITLPTSLLSSRPADV